MKAEPVASTQSPGTPGPNSLWQLDAVRGAAAAYIAAGHICRDQLDTVVPGLKYLLGFGQEVVIAFFLLSGFVIHWSVEHKPALSFGAYLRARALRIYPLFILTLALTCFLAWLHHSTDPRTSWTTLLGNLLMLQDWGAIKPGVWVEVYGGVLVLWSLSYEWWFYLLYFPVSRKIPPARQIMLVAVVTVSQALVYLWCPNQASRFLLYFAIWWTGVELARAKLARLPLTFATLAGPLTLLALIAALLSFEVGRQTIAGVRLQAGVHPVLELRHFVAALAITSGALLWHRLHWAGFRPLLGGFARLAPYAYAVYLLHEPLALHSGLMNFASSPWLRVLLDGVMVLAAAWLAERYIQGWCRRVFLG